MVKVCYDMLENIIEDNDCQEILEEYGIFNDEGILEDLKDSISHEKIDQVISSIYLDFNESISAWHSFSNEVNNIEVNKFDSQDPVMSAFYARMYNHGHSINHSMSGEENFINFKKAILTGKEKYAVGKISDTYPFQIKKYPDGDMRHSVVGKSINVSMNYATRENHFVFEIDGLDIASIRIELTPMSAALYKLFCKKNRRIMLRHILDNPDIFDEFCNIYKFSEKVSETKVKTLLKKKQSSDAHYIGNRISDLNKELCGYCVHPGFLLEKGKDDFYYIPIFQTKKIVIEK